MPVRKYGWKPSLPDQRDLRYSAGYVDMQALPAVVDLRNKMPAVYDQLNLGACTANAIAGAIEYEMGVQHATIGVPSRLFIYYNERVLEGSVASDTGASLRDGMKTVAKNGVCPEKQWAYNPVKFTDHPPAVCYDNALHNIVTSYSSVPQNLTQMKTLLSVGHPICVGISIYDSFESDEVAASGMVPMPRQKENMLGGHAVLIVGYSVATSMFLVRNSWGADWGIGGYCEMPFAYLLDSQLSGDFWSIKLIK